jgi:hypothetical protein
LFSQQSRFPLLVADSFTPVGCKYCNYGLRVWCPPENLRVYAAAAAVVQTFLKTEGLSYAVKKEDYLKYFRWGSPVRVGVGCREVNGIMCIGRAGQKGQVLWTASDGVKYALLLRS